MFPNCIWVRSGKSHRSHFMAAITVTTALHFSVCLLQVPDQLKTWADARRKGPHQKKLQISSFKLLICRMICVWNSFHILRTQTVRIYILIVHPAYIITDNQQTPCALSINDWLGDYRRQWTVAIFYPCFNWCKPGQEKTGLLII